MNASFEEKSVWITLLGLLAVYGFYFWVAGQMLSAGVTAVSAYSATFVATAVGLIVVLTVSHIVAAVVSRPEGRDERDRLISWRAEHGSSWLLAVGVLGAITALALSVEPAWVANGLMMALVLTEVLNHVLQLYYYRRGV